jgi:hypothetical protein
LLDANDARPAGQVVGKKARELTQAAANVEDAFDGLKVDRSKAPRIDEFVERRQAPLFLGRGAVDVKRRYAGSGHGDLDGGLESSLPPVHPIRRWTAVEGQPKRCFDPAGRPA